MARACGGESQDGLWHGWIEFLPIGGAGDPLRSPRETTQPNRTDTVYWATGLTAVYLEGALHRALHPLRKREPVDPGAPLFNRSAPEAAAQPSAQEPILNPFSVYQKGEMLLRRQLAAFSSWHLVNIIRGHQLETHGRDPDRLLPSELIELIVSEVRRAYAPRRAGRFRRPAAPA